MMDDDDYLYERMKKEWEDAGRPCLRCASSMIYDSKRSNQVTRPIPNNVYGTREPVYRYYRCLECYYEM